MNASDPTSIPDDAGRFLPKPPRAEVTTAWLAEQGRKQAVYSATRAAWNAGIAGLVERPRLPVTPCTCKQCGRPMRGGAQLRLPF